MPDMTPAQERTLEREWLEHCKANDMCPRCRGEFTRRKVRYPEYFTDTDWWECSDCGFQTDPE